MAELFSFHIPVWEILLRGTCVYWFLFLLFRFALRRDAGSMGLADILFIVLIADAAQNGISGEYKSISEAFVLIGTIAGWNGFIDWMTFRFPWFARWAEPKLIVLVAEGKVLQANLRKEMLTEDELMGHLRAAGVDDVSLVKKAILEPGGTISVIPRTEIKRAKVTKHRTPGAA